MPGCVHDVMVECKLSMQYVLIFLKIQIANLPCISTIILDTGVTQSNLAEPKDLDVFKISVKELYR